MIFNGGEYVTYIGYKPLTSNGMTIASKGESGVVLATKARNKVNDLFSDVTVSFENNIICLQVSSLNLRLNSLNEEDDFRTIFDRIAD